jgi:class 3 adenylate cyclase/tetratricopeptide (TPR) repeat protein
VRLCAQCGEESVDHARFCHACGSVLQEGHSPADTRRLVTVVFSDLVDSTPLTGSLDPESVRTVLARYFERMRETVERHGGRVEKFIGDAVMAVFGVPRVHEDALRAVRAAAEMRDALAALNKELERDWGVRLQARTGVDTGEVVAGDASGGQSLVTGEAVNRAARLEQAAGPDEVLLGDDTFRLVRDAVAVEEAGRLELKGLREPIRAHRLLGVIPGATGHARRFDSPLVDRELEQAMLRQTFDRVVSGNRCQLFTVLGPPGIGKSRLVEEFLSWCGDRSTSLRGRCLPYGEGITFWPVAEVVAQAAGLTDSDSREVAGHKLAELLTGVENGELVAERVGQAVGLTAGSPAPEETLWAIRRLLELLARNRPLVLEFEDIHWGEPTFLELIEHIADRSRDAPIMLICPARPELLEIRPDWGGGEVNATTITLDPLAASDTEALVTNLLGAADLAPEVRGRIVETAGGYPLFAEEIVSALIDDEMLTREADRWVPAADLSKLSLPSTISALLAARLDRLDAAERAVLQRASVIGRDFYAAEVAALSPLADDTPVEQHLLSLERKELIRPAASKLSGKDAYRFRHMLVRDAAYDAMAKSTRAELHELYAGWLDETSGDRIDEYEEVLAHHLERAYRLRVEVGPSDERVDALGHRAGTRFAAAGRRAAARGDMPATVKLLGKAADLMPRADERRLELLPHLADGLFQAGEIDRAHSVLAGMLHSARGMGSEVLEARALLEQYTWQLVTDPMATTGDDLRAVAENAVRVFEEHEDDENLAAALEALAIAHRLVTGDIGAMLEAAERGLTLAQRAGSWPAAVSSAANLAEALVMGPTTCDLALGRLESLVDSFEGEPMAQAALDLKTALVLAMLHRFAEAHERLAGSSGVFEDLGQNRWAAEAAHTRGVITWWEGDPVAAEPSLRAAHGFFRSRGEASDAALFAADLAQVLCDLDSFDEADELARGIAREMPAYALEPQIGWRRAMARARARRGAVAEAEDLAREAEAIAARTDFLCVHAGSLLDLGEVLHLAGRNREAAETVRRALERSERKGDRVGARRSRSLLVAIGGAECA